MGTYISILRGINVGGKRKMAMEDLRALYAKLGYSNITTYIQSGNVVFKTTSTPTNVLEDTIQLAIKKEFGYDVPVITRRKEEITNLVEIIPFSQNNINNLYVTFLKNIPEETNTIKLKENSFAPDKFEIKENHVFIYCEGKYHQSKLTNNFFEQKLKVEATTRNWKTVLKIIELSSQ